MSVTDIFRKKQRRIAKKVVGYSEQVAHTLHTCSNCNESIFPGDLYARAVWFFKTISGRRWIRVEKQHLMPG